MWPIVLSSRFYQGLSCPSCELCFQLEVFIGLEAKNPICVTGSQLEQHNW